MTDSTCQGIRNSIQILHTLLLKEAIAVLFVIAASCSLLRNFRLKRLLEGVSSHRLVWCLNLLDHGYRLLKLVLELNRIIRD